MKTNFLRTICCTLAVFAMLFGCQIKDCPPPERPQPLAATADCPTDSLHWFNLDTITPTANGQTMDYAWDLVTSAYPFKLNECHCQVQRYELMFDSLPAANRISVTDQNGNALPFSIETDDATGLETIVVPAEVFEDGCTKVFIEIDVVPVPAVQQAGGLCIVDNLSGLYTVPDTTVTHLKPVFYWDLPPQSPPLRLLLIPEAMTSPYMFSIPL